MSWNLFFVFRGAAARKLWSSACIHRAKTKAKFNFKKLKPAQDEFENFNLAETFSIICLLPIIVPKGLSLRAC